MPVSPPIQRRGLPRAFVALAVAVGIVVGAWVALSLVSFAARDTERSTTRYPATRELRIETGAGDVTIFAERRDDVSVTTEIRHGLWRPDAGQQLRGNRLSLTGGCGFWAGVGIDACRISFEVRVPFGTGILAETSSGDMRVTGTRAAVSLTASSGDLHALDVSGPLRLAASSGDVHVEGYRGKRLDARTSSGDVDVSTALVARRVTATASSGDVHVQVPDGSYRIAANTHSGDENVSLPNDPDAANVIEATTSSGDVHVSALGD